MFGWQVRYLNIYLFYLWPVVPTIALSVYVGLSDVTESMVAIRGNEGEGGELKKMEGKAKQVQVSPS